MAEDPERIARTDGAPARSLERSAILTLLAVLFIGPGPFLVAIPWWISGGFAPTAFATPPVRILGALLVLAGLVPLADSLARFVREGRGTPVPAAPPDYLVVTGFYRHVRNPMYVGIVLVLAGEVLWCGSLPLLLYAFGFAPSFHLWVTRVEEPGLARRYGEPYARYAARVPRWIPRIRPATDAELSARS
jgi:protein-S-isoprenylcysteine O-methyltransferase Ste14